MSVNIRVRGGMSSFPSFSRHISATQMLRGHDCRRFSEIQKQNALNLLCILKITNIRENSQQAAYKWEIFDISSTKKSYLLKFGELLSLGS